MPHGTCKPARRSRGRVRVPAWWAERDAARQRKREKVEVDLAQLMESRKITMRELHRKWAEDEQRRGQEE